MPELICRADDRAAWLAARLSGVTATDIVTILGLSTHDSPYSLYWRKMGQVPEPADTDRWQLGRDLEPIVMRRWTQVNRDRLYLRAGLYRSTARPWQMATPDRLTDAEEPVEAKTWADADKASWGHPGAFQGPASVRAQVLWQMDVMDAGVGHVGVLFLPSGEFRSYVIEHKRGPELEPGDHGHFSGECEVCSDLAMMRAAGEEFWRRLRMELPPPDPDNSAATLAAAKARFAKAKGKRGQVDPSLWQGWRMLKDDIDHFTGQLRGYETQIREQLGEADEIEVDGQLVGRRRVYDSHVKAYTRHVDGIWRVNQQGSDDE